MTACLLGYSGLFIDEAHGMTEMNSVATVAEQASNATENASAATEETSASTQQVAASADDLATTADELQRLVGGFRLAA